MENTTTIARVEHLAKIYAAQAVKPPQAQRPKTPEDLPNAQALTRVADLARVGAEVIEGQVSWRGQMCKAYLDLATELIGRGIGFGYYGGDNPATTAAVGEIDRLRAEVTRLTRGIGLAQVALRDHAPDTVWFDSIETLFDMLEGLRDPKGEDPISADEPASPADPPAPPWPPSHATNSLREGWKAYFADRARDDSPFPPIRADLHAGYREGWDAAEQHLKTQTQGTPT